MIILVLWAALVSQLASTTKVYHDCKDKICTVKVKDIGYEIVKTDK
jgi:hypothetical protein